MVRLHIYLGGFHKSRNTTTFKDFVWSFKTKVHFMALYRGLNEKKNMAKKGVQEDFSARCVIE